jgi:hypothetical protein
MPLVGQDTLEVLVQQIRGLLVDRDMEVIIMDQVGVEVPQPLELMVLTQLEGLVAMD